MAFEKGTWTQLPSNCSRDYNVTFSRCAAYGTIAVTKCVSWAINAAITCVQWATQALTTCVQWATQTATNCVQWATQTSSHCCDWWPCSWLCDIVMVIISVVCVVFAVVVSLVCVVFALVVSVVCILFALVVTIVCAIVALIVYIFCVLWSVISIIFCISNADGGTAFLLTDGTVMMQECQFGYGTRRWWKLTPDQNGSYINGSWSRLADSNIGRKYFASAVLADGRVVVCGGEYSDATSLYPYPGDDTNTCEIYDPVADSWTAFSAPNQPNTTNPWTNIGDSPCALLPDGTFLLGSYTNANLAKLDPATLTWTSMNDRPGGASSEESWVLMPDNTVASVSCISPGVTWVYDIAGDQWNMGNNLPTSIIQSEEIGPGLLLYNQKAFFMGSNQHTAIYDPSATPQWSNAGDVTLTDGTNVGTMDGPGAMLVDGNVLFGAAPLAQDYDSPTSYFEFDGTVFNPTNNPPNSDCPTYYTRLLLLPNGDVMFAREDDSSFYTYRPASAQPQDSFRPVIQTFPAMLAAGTTVQISGTQFNGLSQAVAYGDDSEAATNYPLVQIVNKQTNHVRFCRTSNHVIDNGNGGTVTSMGVATGAFVVTTNAAIPSDIETGASSLIVIANGIPSQPVDVTVVRRDK